MKNFLIFCAIVAILTGCSDDSDKKTTQKIENTSKSVDANWPTYRVGVDPTHVPYVTRDYFSRPAGFEVDLLREVGKREHFNVTFVPVLWRDVLNRLEDHSVDIICSGMLVTPEREARAALTIPNSHFHFELLTRANSPYQNLNNLNGTKIAVVGAAPIINFMKSFTKGVNFQIETFPSSFWAMRCVMNGDCAAVFIPDFVANHYIRTMPKSYYNNGFREIPLINGGNALRPTICGVRKEDTDLLNKINNGFKKAEADGTMSKLRIRWFGTDTK